MSRSGLQARETQVGGGHVFPCPRLRVRNRSGIPDVHLPASTLLGHGPGSESPQDPSPASLDRPVPLFPHLDDPVLGRPVRHRRR